MALARQTDLPGMTDRKLKDLHEAAYVYADARDARVKATAPEVEAKTKLLELMKKHKLEHYKFDNVAVDLVHEKENVRVRIEPIEEEPTNGKAKDDFPTMPKKQKKAVEKGA